MKDTAVIACAMLEDELTLVLKETGCTYPVTFLPRALHNTPHELRRHLQDTLRDLPDTITTVLLAYGYCGGSLEGIESGRRTLIFPLTTDCIDLWLNNLDKQSGRRNDTLYFTPDWTVDPLFIGREYEACKNKHGKDMAKKIFESYLKGYTRISFLDTGASEKNKKQAALNTLEATAKTLDLTFECSMGSVGLLRNLLTGPWNEQFFVVAPGEKVTLNAFLDALNRLR